MRSLEWRFDSAETLGAETDYIDGLTAVSHPAATLSGTREQLGDAVCDLLDAIENAEGWPREVRVFTLTIIPE